MALPQISLDKIRGMLMGLAVGDALAAGYDNQPNRFGSYNGYLQESINKVVKSKGTFSLAPGTLTDVTQLPIIVSRNMLVNPAYPWQRSMSVGSYLAWANSGTYWIDPEMDKLFKGVRSDKGYESRYSTMVKQAPSTWSFSNGPLYRCIPLSLINDNIFTLNETLLTHNQPMVSDASVLYVTALRLAARDVDMEEIINAISVNTQHQTITEALSIGLENRIVTLTGKGKDDCFNIFYLIGLCRANNIETLQDALDFVITSFPFNARANAGLIGALFGAYFGFEAINLEEKTNFNIATILNEQSRLNTIYSLGDFDTLCYNLHQNFSN